MQEAEKENDPQSSDHNKERTEGEDGLMQVKVKINLMCNRITNKKYAWIQRKSSEKSSSVCISPSKAKH